MCAKIRQIRGEWIPYAVYVYNTTVHTTTAYTPFELVYGFKSEVPSALREPPNVQYNYNNNNNNNNIYLLQLGCYPVAVVILHVNKT